jgi:sortase A
MQKTLRILLTTALLLLLIVPVIYFIIYPNYNELIGPIKRFDIQRSAHEVTFQVLTSIAPTKNMVLGIKQEFETSFTIEESLGQDFVFEDSFLEILNTIIKVDSIEVEGKVYEGIDSNTMNLGFWHFPISSLPGKKGNFVIIGHRYANLPPKKNTFFNLDKVRVGDKIEVLQSESHFTYIVTETKVVEKNDVSILHDFSDYRITLITCTPLWTANQRLVIVGKLDKLYKNT